MSIFSAYLAALGFASLFCDVDAFPPEYQKRFETITISGIYTAGFEMRSFKPCESDEVWWLPDRDVNDKYHKRVVEKPATYWHVRIKALVSPLGEFGHLGGYARCVTDVELISAKESQTNECRK